MDGGLDHARALLPGVRLERVETLRGGERSEVRRVRAEFPDSAGASSVIVKRFLMAGEGWAREAAALASLPPDAPAPKVLAEGAAPPVIVMSDLGPGPNVAAALLGDSPEAATGAVLDWAEAVAKLHRATFGHRQEFRAALSMRAGDLPVADHVMPALADETALLLDARCAELGVSVPHGALSELRELPRQLRADDNAALSPSDTCPDDNVRTHDGVALVDFEGAQWRHIAWDVAYLTVPWPSCWCAWRMPHDVAERAVEHYRGVVEDALPYVRSPQFRHDLTAATTGWTMISTASFLSRALADDPPPTDPGKPTPARRALILHRLSAARRTTELPALAELAARLRENLLTRWGEVPLGYAPAFEQS
jgi:hypothetical protein